MNEEEIKKLLDNPIVKDEISRMVSEELKKLQPRHRGLPCHVCHNKNPRCSTCGGEGTPWLI